MTHEKILHAHQELTQLAFTRPKLAIETLKQGAKYV